jgi:hypothetical protein
MHITALLLHTFKKPYEINGAGEGNRILICVLADILLLFGRFGNPTTSWSRASFSNDSSELQLEYPGHQNLIPVSKMLLTCLSA